MMSEDKIARWQSVVEQSPDDELARFTLAKACMSAGRLDEAKDHFARAIELQADWMMAHILLARCHVELDEGAQAKPVLARARQLAIEQDHGDPLIEIDEMLEEIG